MRALKLTAAGEIAELDLDLTPDVVRREVGGFAQVPLFDDPATALIVDEDARPRRLPVNSTATRLVRYRRLGAPILGDALVVGIDEDGNWAACPVLDLTGAPWSVTVYHNTNREALAPSRGYQHGDPLTLVARYHTIATSVDAVLDRAWFLFNVGDDPDFGPPAPVAVAYRERRNRSLSVGDVLAVTDGNVFAVASPSGFTWVETLTVTNATTHGTTPLDGAS
ncbi:MAG TPA: DUF3846 domain-containing protein [Mycobacteriales bacterium]|jgi:hypothetical protein|nr:DUF3846 domain-containing protein [Mycobacteriales bacterium]